MLSLRFAWRAPSNSDLFFCAFGYIHGSSRYLKFRELSRQIFSNINGVLFLSMPIDMLGERFLIKLCIDSSG